MTVDRGDPRERAVAERLIELREALDDLDAAAEDFSRRLARLTPPSAERAAARLERVARMARQLAAYAEAERAIIEAMERVELAHRPPQGEA